MTKKTALSSLLILSAGAGLAFVISGHSDKQQQPVRAVNKPQIHISQTHQQSHSFTLHSQGTLTSQVQAAVAAETSGKLIEAPLFPGDFVRKGDIIARLDTAQQQAAIEVAAAAVAEASAEVAEMEAAAAVAKLQLAGTTVRHSALALKQPQLRKAQARLQAARAQLGLLQTELEKTRIRAPFDGLVISKLAETGEYIVKGQALLRLDGTDSGRIRVPLSQQQLELLGAADGQLPAPIPVQLKIERDGQSWYRDAKLTHTEAAVQSAEQLHHGVVELADPYLKTKNDSAVKPIVFGSFVEVSVRGQRQFQVSIVPDKLLLAGRQLIVVEQSALQLRDVTVLYRDGEKAYISAGLQDGDWIAATPVANPIPGMQVATQNRPLFDNETRSAYQGAVQ